jgi:hypothetical protein
MGLASTKGSYSILIWVFYACFVLGIAYNNAMNNVGGACLSQSVDKGQRWYTVSSMTVLPVEYQAFLDRLNLLWVMARNRNKTQPLPPELLLLLLKYGYVREEKLSEDELDEIEALVSSNELRIKEEPVVSGEWDFANQAVVKKANGIMLMVEGLRQKLMLVADHYSGENPPASWGEEARNMMVADLVRARFGQDFDALRKYYLAKFLLEQVW